MRVPITDVPLEARRVAAQHLESLRGTELLNGAEDAHLDAHAVPIYRPDIDGIAYYELTVVGSGGQGRLLLTRGYSSVPEAEPRKARKTSSTEQTGSGESAGGRVIGFIVASNGRHDFPVAHWSLNRLPPSRQVTTDPRTGCDPDERREVNAARLYRLDALAYAAESEDGELVGQSGQLPGLLSGLPHALEGFAGQIASASARPLRADRDDSSAQDARHEVERSKHEPPTLKRSDEGGWKAFKERYADAFGPLLDHLRTRAARTWELEDLIRKSGEGILAGTSHRAALLGEAAIELRGEGAKYVEPTIEENPSGPPSLVLRVRPVSLRQEVDFDVVVRYRNGEHEKLRFFVVSREVPSNVRAEQSHQRHPDCEE